MMGEGLDVLIIYLGKLCKWVRTGNCSKEGQRKFAGARIMD